MKKIKKQIWLSPEASKAIEKHAKNGKMHSEFIDELILDYVKRIEKPKSLLCHVSLWDEFGKVTAQVR